MADTPTGFTYDPTIVIEQWPVGLRPDGMSLHLESNTTTFTAPFTRSTQTQELPGARFALSGAFPLPTPDKVRIWRAFLAKLRGSSGRFYFRAEIESGAIPGRGEAEPISTARLTVDTTRFSVDREDITLDAEQHVGQIVMENTSSVDSATITATCRETVGSIVLFAGQHISFDDASGWRSLHVVVDDVVVQSGFLVSIKVEPPMRVRPSAGAPLHITRPSGIFMLADDTQGGISQTSGQLVHAAIDAMEAFPPRIVVSP